MLQLLEEHHKRLADIIRTRDVIAKQLVENGAAVPEKTESMEQVVAVGGSTQAVAIEPPIKSQRSSSSVFAKVQEQQHRRDSSPALAKDMASRRGIPQAQRRKIPPPITGSTPAASHSPDSTRRKAHNKHHEVVDAPSVLSTAQVEERTNPADDGFSRFYSGLTSGPFSKISSMLAFAALPLSEPPSQPSSPTSSRVDKTVRAHNEPDISKLISSGAMKALEDSQRRKGDSGKVFGPGESFYVVPPSGGTASYANIMRTEQRYARRQQGHLSNIEEDNEFVDARETQHPKTGAYGSGPGLHLKVAGSGPGTSTPNHKAEELELENETLKQVLDQLSHRLQAFERSAQDASMAALTQSMASVRTTGGGRVDEGIGDRERIMEDELQRAVREISKLKGQNQKYKDYLERLKDSARQRDKVKKEKGEGGV